MLFIKCQLHPAIQHNHISCDQKPAAFVHCPYECAIFSSMCPSAAEYTCSAVHGRQKHGLQSPFTKTLFLAGGLQGLSPANQCVLVIYHAGRGL
jgi:hypothetical protein